MRRAGAPRRTLESLLRALERGQSDKLDGLAEGGEVLGGLLDLLQAVADGVGLVDDLEDLCRGAD